MTVQNPLPCRPVPVPEKTLRRPARIPRPAPGTLPLRVPARSRTRARIVLALSEGDRPTAGLRRAMALSRAFDAHLHVVIVLPRLKSLRALFGGRTVVTAARMVERTLREYRATRSWLSDVFCREDATPPVAVAHGDFVHQVAAYAATLDAKLIVLAPGDDPPGKSVAALACATSVPVLVAREHAGAPAIVAATDLQNDKYPVLDKGGELARRLQCKVIAVHNVAPKPEDVSLAWSINMSMPVLASGLRDARAGRLTQVIERLPLDTRAVVREELSASEAILNEARAHDADLVVVGTRPRKSWLAAASTAARVVNGTERSVVVLPLGDECRVPMATGRDTRPLSP